MSFTYLQEGEVVFSEGYCWDTDPCALLSLTNMQERSYLPDKQTTPCHTSQSGMMSRPLTVNRGPEKSMLSAGDSLAKTSVALGKGQELKVKEVAFGKRCSELSVKYDRSTSLLKTHHCLWEEVLQPFCVILPKWGMMQDGVFLAQAPLEVGTYAKDAGCWPTPLKQEGPGGSHKKLTDAVAIAEGWKPKYYKEPGTEERKAFTGKVNPEWVEWLMGWPMGWTNVSQELGMDKYHLWRQQHGVF